MGLKTVHIVSPRALLGHALPQLVESALGPAALFYVILSVVGFRGALVGSLAWTYLALVRRALTNRRLPALLLIASALLTLRTITALVTGSAFVYFLQPSVGTFLVATAFLVSVPTGKPLAERLARDLCPLDPELLDRPFICRFFLRVSLLWSMVLLVNALLGLWFLLTESVGNFVLMKTTVPLLVTGAAVAFSILWFRRILRGEVIAVRWATVGSAPGRSRLPDISGR